MEDWLFWLLLSLGFYILISQFFFYFPQLLHKKKEKTIMNSVKNISHRGGAGEAPENTIVAFQRSLTCGSDMFELDLQLTRDNVVVVCHDPSLNRVMGVAGHVSDYNYADLPKKFREDLVVQFSGDVLDTRSFETYIPTLEELFQKFPTIPMNIDLKDKNPKLLEETYKLIKKYNREKLVVWGNFADSTCDRCYAKDPTIPILFGIKSTFKLMLFYYTGILPFIPLKQSFYEFPVFSKHTTALIPSKYVKWVLLFNHHVLVSKRLYSHLNKRGISVISWVINHEEDFEFCFKNGINAVITDYPSQLTKYLSKKGKTM